MPVKPNREVAVAVAGRLHSAAIHLLRKVKARDRSMGIGPAQASALSVLVFGGARSLKELAEAEGVKPPTMSRIVAGLERSRLVRRHATEDKRRVRLEATPRGVKIMHEGRRRRVQALARAVASFAGREKQRLGEVAALLEELIRKI